MNEKIIKQILETTVQDDTKTIELMDKYEGFGKEISYVQLVLRNIACLEVNGRYVYISLVVERSKDNRHIGNITFSELKKGTTKSLYEFIREQLNEDVLSRYMNEKAEYRFGTPYLFRAQNSKNRSGYGWGYGGTQYGETTAYVFVGAYIGYRVSGFSDEINRDLEEADLSEYTIKNISDNTSDYGDNRKTIKQGFETSVDIADSDFDKQNDGKEIEYYSDMEFVTEKRCISDDDTKPDWFFSGFVFEINMFILALEQNVYLPPVIDECENCMHTDEIVQDYPGDILTDMEKTLMFIEMLANEIGYSGLSVLGLDLIHKRKILNNVLLRNYDGFIYGEYGDNTVSFHLVSDFLENQPELNYRGFVEIVLSMNRNEKDEIVYELTGEFRDFGENEVPTQERKYWTGKDRYVLDIAGTGSYLQAIYEMAMNY